MENKNKIQAEKLDSNNEKLLLSDVSKQRELLIAFLSYMTKKGYGYAEIYKESIDDFLKSN